MPYTLKPFKLLSEIDKSYMSDHSATRTDAKVLRLNTAGIPIEWVSWQDAVCLYARDLVVWSLGNVVRKVSGGWCRLTGKRSELALAAIIACGGSRLARPKNNPPDAAQE